MSRTKALEKVKLTRFDDLFGGKEEPVVEAGEVKQIPISELHEFHNHHEKKAVMRLLQDIQEDMFVNCLVLIPCRFL